MKNLFSLALTAAILIISVLSFNVFAAETTKTEALLNKMNTAQEVSVTLRTGKGSEYGSDYGVTTTVGIKGDKLAFNLNNGFVDMRAVVTEDKIIGFLPTFPIFCLEADSPFEAENGVWSVIEDLSDITMLFLYHVDDYNETVAGTQYYVEEFNDREFVTSKFYYIGDELKMLRVEDVQKNTVQYTYFDKIAFEVDDSFFNTPSFTINITPIMKIFFSSLVDTILPA